MVEEARENIMWALGEIKDPIAAELLIKTLDYGLAAVEYSAAEALGKIKEEKSVRLIVRAWQNLEDGSPVKGGEQRSWMIEALRMMGDFSIEALTKILKDEDSYDRNTVVQILRQMEDKKVVEPLIKALNDADECIRFEAINALAMIKDPRALKSLLTATKDEDSQVGDAAQRALDDILDNILDNIKEKLNNEKYRQK